MFSNPARWRNIPNNAALDAWLATLPRNLGPFVRSGKVVLDDFGNEFPLSGFIGLSAAEVVEALLEEIE